MVVFIVTYLRQNVRVSFSSDEYSDFSPLLVLQYCECFRNDNNESINKQKIIRTQSALHNAIIYIYKQETKYHIKDGCVLQSQIIFLPTKRFFYLRQSGGEMRCMVINRPNANVIRCIKTYGRCVCTLRTRHSPQNSLSAFMATQSNGRGEQRKHCIHNRIFSQMPTKVIKKQ